MNKKEFLKEHQVDVDAALEFWGDMDSYSESLKEYIESLNDKLKNLEYYKDSNDYENYGILAHSMKSESKYLGFMKEAEVFLEHELAGKSSDSDTINNKFPELEDTVHQIVSTLEEYFQDENEKKNILIADDSNIMLNFIEKTIQDDFHIIRANNGKDAITEIQNNDIYAILLDLNMPTTNGFEVLEYLKENELLEKIPVVIITGDDTEDTIKKAFTYPILDVLNKPFTDDKIKTILAKVKSFYEKN